MANIIDLEKLTPVAWAGMLNVTANSSSRIYKSPVKIGYLTEKEYNETLEKVPRLIKHLFIFSKSLYKMSFKEIIAFSKNMINTEIGNIADPRSKQIKPFFDLVDGFKGHDLSQAQTDQILAILQKSEFVFGAMSIATDRLFLMHEVNYKKREEAGRLNSRMGLGQKIKAVWHKFTFHVWKTFYNKSAQIAELKKSIPTREKYREYLMQRLEMNIGFTIHDVQKYPGDILFGDSLTPLIGGWKEKYQQRNYSADVKPALEKVMVLAQVRDILLQQAAARPEDERKDGRSR